jgi:hypothetical protein
VLQNHVRQQSLFDAILFAQLELEQDTPARSIALLIDGNVHYFDHWNFPY